MASSRPQSRRRIHVPVAYLSDWWVSLSLPPALRARRERVDEDTRKDEQSLFTLEHNARLLSTCSFIMYMKIKYGTIEEILN